MCAYTKKCAILVAKIKELGSVGSSMNATNLSLVLEDGKARDSEVDKSLEPGSLEVSSQ